MGLVDLSPFVCSLAGYPDLKGWCRYGVAAVVHVALAAAATYMLGRRWYGAAVLYVVYQVLDWYVHEDDLLLNLAEYAVGVCAVFLVEALLAGRHRASGAKQV